MGMLVHIYRPAEQRSEEDRKSIKHNVLCLTNVPGPFAPTQDSPAAVLLRQETGNLIVVPQELLDSGRWFTFGGNYAYTSDHRFTETVEAISGYLYAFPVAIHDRIE